MTLLGEALRNVIVCVWREAGAIRYSSHNALNIREGAKNSDRFAVSFLVSISYIREGVEISNTFAVNLLYINFILVGLEAREGLG